MKRALLIGVNRYSNIHAHLRGCLNDVDELHELLSSVFSFDEIHLLRDEEATSQRIMNRIENMVEQSRPGHVLFVHFSGHGSRVKDITGKNPDGFQEAWCPSDVNWDNSDSFVRDSWIRATMNRLRGGVACTVFSDCCHYGANTRSLLPADAPVIPRYIPSPWALQSRSQVRSQAQNLLERPQIQEAARSNCGQCSGSACERLS